MKVNWYPDKWNIIEKNKLFDFWRNRYCKNKIVFSPSNDTFGGIGFYDASYESLKFDEKHRHKQVVEEYNQRKRFLLKELENSKPQDQKRLKILIDVEEKAFDYWEAKIILKPIEEDIPSILNQSIWLIDEKERIFKEAFSYLLEYDRTYYSPLTFPDRKMEDNPLNISESYVWLTRVERFLSKEDQEFFNKNKKSIKPLNVNIEQTFIPFLLSERHERALKRESKKGIERTSNGDILNKDKEEIDVFERPDLIYADGNGTLEELINDFKSKNVKQYNTNYENDIKIFKSDNKTSMDDIFSSIPKSPYVVLQAKLFNSLQNGNENFQSAVLEELKFYIKERELRQKVKKSAIQAEIIEEESIFKNLFYFLAGKNKIEEGEVRNRKINKSKLFKKDGITFISEDEYEDLLPFYEDDFDDKTRFGFIIKDKFGYQFDRKKAIEKVLKTKQQIKNKFAKLSQKAEKMMSIIKFKNLVKDKKIDLGFNNDLSNKVASMELKDHIENLRKEIMQKELKVEQSLRKTYKF